MIFRELVFEEIDQIWQMDRTEHVDASYYLHDGVLKEKSINQTFYGWPPNEAENAGPVLKDCFKRGGLLYGAFNDDQLIAVVVLDNRWIDDKRDTLLLKYMYIDRNFRKQGIGKELFKQATERAKALGARRVYISATESKNTVDFYMHQGCTITEEIDEYLYQLEPNDIHLEYILTNQ